MITREGIELFEGIVAKCRALLCPRLFVQVVLLLLANLLLASAATRAAVLPEERADLLYHSYDGGGATIDGPSVLVRKNLGDSLSVGLNHYLDNVTSASIDVVVSGASEYTENREENTLSFDYLSQKTTMSLGYTTSIENDFDATTLSLGVSQDMFGDLTTISMSFAIGDNIITQTGNATFEETARVRSYRVGVSQIMTKDLVMAFTLETITDEGFLNNPYRSTRFLNPDGITYTFDDEVYPRTRTSNAIAIRGNYFLPQRAALHAGIRIFEDSWGIEATTTELGYTFPYNDDFILEATFRFHDQSQAEFYSDLFPFQNSQNFLARDKELSSFASTTLGIGASYEFGRGWSAIERGSLNAQFDFISFDYDNFRDLTVSAPAGTEPLYSFDATVTRLFASIWF